MSNNNQNMQHLDKSVIYLFLATFLISASVLAYKYTKYSPCEDVSYEVKAQRYTIGELIKFNDGTIGATSWHWDFGDNTTAQTQKEAIHNYKRPGEYVVTLIVNNTCERTKTITINDKKVVIDSTKFPVFEIPKSIMVGKTLRVEDKTLNATTWEWRFGETAGSNAKTKNAKYEYKEPGLKTISLIVNGDLKYITKKRIEVIPTPESKKTFTEPIVNTKPKGWNIKLKPEIGIEKVKNSPKVVPYISDLEFANKIILVSQEKMSPKQFSEYFCGDVNKPVIVNGKNTTFLVFCEKIKDKKIKLKKVELFRNKGSNCIKTITVDYKKTGLF